jgi:hypothetical protein
MLSLKLWFPEDFATVVVLAARAHNNEDPDPQNRRLQGRGKLLASAEKKRENAGDISTGVARAPREICFNPN